jgi:hypothetical protein
MTRNCNRVTLRTLLVALCTLASMYCSPALTSAATITAPPALSLQRDTPGQTLQILVSGPEEVAGMSFAVQNERRLGGSQASEYPSWPLNSPAVFV